MFIGILRWLVTFIALSFLMTWCFLNRMPVLFDFSPAHDPVQVPLFALILGAAILGFLWGTLMTWLGAATERAQRRALKRELRQAQSELIAARDETLSRHPDAVIDGLLPTGPKGRFRS